MWLRRLRLRVDRAGRVELRARTGGGWKEIKRKEREIERKELKWSVQFAS